MAQLLLDDRLKAPASSSESEPPADPSTEPPTEPERIGIHWVRNFVNRHDSIKSKYSRKYDYERAQCEDPKILSTWFELVRKTIEKYGILTEDIYNFDETGFQMGVAATAKVITSTQRNGRPKVVQPGNKEWVT